MNKKPYSSAIKKTPFKYPIAKKIAKLMLEGLDYDEILKTMREAYSLLPNMNPSFSRNQTSGEL